MTRHALLIGAGGLIGKSLVRELRDRAHWRIASADSLPWHDRAAVLDALEASLTHAISQVDVQNDSWTVLWTAGGGVIATEPERLDRERETFEAALDVIDRVSARTGSSRTGTIFFASSAGGVYGGSAHPPFTEETPPIPISPYGATKLAMEEALDAFHERTGISVLKGRIANVYGPGQKLDKPQGLISQLAKAQLSPTPANLFVPLDTTRDYLFATDCARLIVDCVERLDQERARGNRLAVTKILASGSAVTVGSLLGHFRMLARFRPHVALGSSPVAQLQSLDLRLESRVWPELDQRELTPLPAGIHATLLDISRAIQEDSRIIGVPMI